MGSTLTFSLSFLTAGIAVNWHWNGPSRLSRPPLTPPPPPLPLLAPYAPSAQSDNVHINGHWIKYVEMGQKCSKWDIHCLADSIFPHQAAGLISSPTDTWWVYDVSTPN